MIIYSSVTGTNNSEESTKQIAMIRPTPLNLPFESSPLMAKALPWSCGRKGNLTFSKTNVMAKPKNTAITESCEELTI